MSTKRRRKHKRKFKKVMKELIKKEYILKPINVEVGWFWWLLGY